MGNDLWVMGQQGYKEFNGGKQDWDKAAAAARQCGLFSADDEDEQTSDELLSCYNCRYRRWTVNSFQCIKGG